MCNTQGLVDPRGVPEVEGVSFYHLVATQTEGYCSLVLQFISIKCYTFSRYLEVRL